MDSHESTRRRRIGIVFMICGLVIMLVSICLQIATWNQLGAPNPTTMFVALLPIGMMLNIVGAIIARKARKEL